MYYHGTSLTNSLKINGEQKMYHKYGKEIGVFLTKDIYEARAFGNMIIAIDESMVDETRLTDDGINDGLFYNGVLELTEYYNIVDLNGKRIEKVSNGVTVSVKKIKSFRNIEGVIKH